MTGVAGPRTEPLRALLVEDNAGDAALLQALVREAETGSVLRPQTYVERVSTKAAAIEALARSPWDVVLLDLGLPDASGLEALATIREVTTVSIVVLTGLDDDDIALAALRAGAQDYLVKGAVSGDLVLRALRYAVERKRTEDALARARWLAGVGVTALTMRHEVNNPLAALLLGADLLRDVPGQDMDTLDKVISSACRIRDIVGRLETAPRAGVVEPLPGFTMLDLSGER